MKLLSYVMTSDTGLAPNPYWGICSLALCTPNHMNAQLKPDDWVVGHSTVATGHRLIYAMRLTKVLDMTTYFHEYKQKRPVLDGTPEQRCGDNFHYFENGQWKYIPSALHCCEEEFEQDQGRQVFLAEGEDNFWYFGDKSLDFAAQFPSLIHNGRGISYERDEKAIKAFSDWLQGMGVRGCIGKPSDQPKFPAI